MTKTIHTRLRKAFEGDWETLLNDLPEPPSGPPKARDPKDAFTQQVKEIQKALEENETTRALKILHGPAQIATDDQIQRELPPMFTKTAQPMSPPPAQADPAIAEQVYQAIIKTLNKPPRRRATGPAGDRYEHYALTATSTPACEALASAILLLCTGNAPAPVMNAIASAQLIPLLKPNGKIRPIACGTALRRIATTAVAAVLTPMIAPTLARSNTPPADRQGLRNSTNASKSFSTNTQVGHSSAST